MARKKKATEPEIEKVEMPGEDAENSTNPRSLTERLDRLERLIICGFKEILSVKDMALYFGKDESSVRRWANEQRFPSYKEGKQIYFKKSEVEQHLLANRQSSLYEIQCEAATRMAIRRMK